TSTGRQGGRHAEHVHLAVVEGSPAFVEVEGQVTVRRPARWVSRNRPFHEADLPAPLPTLMRAHADVVDLTGGLGSVEVLLDRVEGDRTDSRPEQPTRATLPSP